MSDTLPEKLPTFRKRKAAPPAPTAAPPGISRAPEELAAAWRDWLAAGDRWAAEDTEDRDEIDRRRVVMRKAGRAFLDALTASVPEGERLAIDGFEVWHRGGVYNSRRLPKTT